jgi:hypothetical protein
MSLYINSAVASEHRAQLIREAAAWRIRRQAKRAAAAHRVVAKQVAIGGSEPTSVCCHRAACAGCAA